MLPAGPLALVVGHESYGVSVAALDCCDEHVCLSTFGMKRLAFAQHSSVGFNAWNACFLGGSPQTAEISRDA